MMFKPQKGKAYDKLPKKTLDTFDTTQYLVSTKYDGNQIFIVKKGLETRWFTSDWKEFELPTISLKMASYPEDFVLVAEMNYKSIGKLGDRTEVQGKITTERVNFKKGLPCSLDENQVLIRVFDALSFHGTQLVDKKAKDRVKDMVNITMNLPEQLMPVLNVIMSGKEAKALAKKLAKKGWEGCMAVDPEEYYYIGKRVNHSIKLKHRPTADLKCIGIIDGEGKYEDMIGALLLQDKMGRVVRVGSGLSDADRMIHMQHKFIGAIIEIEYEQIIDTYIQPTFIQIREDKDEQD